MNVIFFLIRREKEKLEAELKRMVTLKLLFQREAKPIVPTKCNS
jgi:hypothetical protein